MADEGPDTVSARVLATAAELPAAAWDACAGADNPFLAYAFFRALEDSGSATARTGWRPRHIVIDGADGTPAAILPAYVKSHSMGEYVFDQGWADAFERAGGRYYPKLQTAVPFTPATGPRLLLREPGMAPVLLAAAEALVRRDGLSSAHATFIEPAQLPIFENAGWLIREDQQFHWLNQGYASFEDFLAALSSRKRKAIRKEREQALAGGLKVRHLRGTDLTEAAWDAFWVFYQDTGARKWGRPYLTRSFFSLVTEAMGDRILLMLAERGGRPIAGALNFIGSDTLFGRYWGATEEVPCLHFELCYYQAIEWAIAHKKTRVEAGAQGAHKLARGYMPVTTYSAHHVADIRFRAALADYLRVEREAVACEARALSAQGPYRQDEN